MHANKALASLIAVGVLGIVFAGKYTIDELPLLFDQGLGAYLLGLPTCAYGLVFYVAITVLALKARRAYKTTPLDTPATETPAL
jgi:hypothetical protein